MAVPWPAALRHSARVGISFLIGWQTKFKRRTLDLWIIIEADPHFTADIASA